MGGLGSEVLVALTLVTIMLQDQSHDRFNDSYVCRKHKSSIDRLCPYIIKYCKKAETGLFEECVDDETESYKALKPECYDEDLLPTDTQLPRFKPH